MALASSRPVGPPEEGAVDDGAGACVDVGRVDVGRGVGEALVDGAGLSAADVVGVDLVAVDVLGRGASLVGRVSGAEVAVTAGGAVWLPGSASPGRRAHSITPTAASRTTPSSTSVPRRRRAGEAPSPAPVSEGVVPTSAVPPGPE